MKNFLLLTVLLMSLTGCLNKVEDSKVIAKVGSKIYSIEDINERISNLDPQLKTYFEKKENKVRLLDQIIEEEVIYQLAKKDRMQRNKDFKKTLADLERQALINFYIQQKVDNMAEVTPDEVAGYYKANQVQFSEYETRNLSHILVKTKEEANKVQSLLRKGGSFDELAQKYSIDPSKAQGGQLGWVRKEQLVPEFANAAYRLTKKVPISGVVKSEFGFHIIQFNDSRTVPSQSLDDVYQNISNQILTQKKRDKFKNILDSGKETVNIERSIENL